MELEWLPPDDSRFDAVVALADRHKATLGLLPRGAMSELAGRGRLLVASEGGAVAGYALSEVGRGRVRLIHLCVDPKFRGQGLARLLVNEISRQHAGLSGIRLRCRVDYPANEAWPRLGFAPMNEVPGRGANRAPLMVWFLTHGQPNLFPFDSEGPELLAAIDHNVFIDIEIDRGRHGAAESQALEEDWVSERVRLTLTSASLHEINGLTNSELKRRQRNATARIGILDPTPVDLSAARKSLEGALPNVLAEAPGDFEHLVAAAAIGASVLVTRDQRLIESAAEGALNAANLRVMHPADLLVHLDELAHAERYQPVALQGTAFSVLEWPPGRDCLSPLLDQAGGERKSAFLELGRRLATDPDTTCKMIREPDGEADVAWAVKIAPDSTMNIPFLRVSRSRTASTILRLTLFQLRKEAVAHSISRLRVTDPHIAPAVGVALADSGFRRDGACWLAAALDVTDRATAAAALSNDEPRRIELALDASEEDFDAVKAAAAERHLWPAKLLDSPLPSYIVPIQPRFARELLGLDETLWHRPAELGTSCEHVYYRSPRNSPSCPARVLWYASGTGRDGIGAIVASSQLVEVHEDDPARLHRRFRHLGVYRREDVETCARGGVAEALRFVDTERFARQVLYERLHVLRGDRRIGSLQSPTRIDSDLFDAIYREGTQRAS